MMTKRKQLEVYLRGSRTYVQGSQILGRTGEWLQSGTNTGQLCLIAAKFLKITDCGVVAVANPEIDGLAANWIGEARYDGADGVQTVRFQEVGGEPAPRIQDAPSRIKDFTCDGRLAGSATYLIDGTHESCIAAIIEIVKRLHAHIDRDVQDIWFTGLASVRLPLSAPYQSEATISVRPLLERAQEGRLLTLSRIDFGASAAITPFNIGFSCRVAK